MSALVNEVATRTLVVHDRAPVSDRVVRFELRDGAGRELPAWSPGAHIDIEVSDGLVRQYSLCGDPGDRGAWHIAVLREDGGRGGSRALHDHARAGQTVRVDGPRNNFALDPSPHYLFIASGIGITPILPMLGRADAGAASWRLVYGGRTRASLPFADELVRRYGTRVTMLPQDETGLIDLDTKLAGLTPDTLVYCCGPESLMRAVEQRGAAIPGQLRTERFAAKDTEAGQTSSPIHVRFTESGMDVDVPAGTSILEAAEQAGIDVPFSCREGVCGSCETPVLSGHPDHRDSVLTAAEHDAVRTMMICVSRPNGPLVLAL
jgi:ferredoxin-NADP reductase